MKKKLLSLTMGLVLTLSMLSACGSGDDNNKPATTSQPTNAGTNESTPAGNGESQNTTPAGADTATPTEAPKGDVTYTISDKVIADEYILTPTQVEVTDEMCEDAIMHTGNLERLASVMARASAGEDITIAYIGGSITDGSLATPQKTNCYAGLTQEWWNLTFQDSNITYVNAGIGATDSYLGVHRATQDVLTHKPDLVVV